MSRNRRRIAAAWLALFLPAGLHSGGSARADDSGAAWQLLREKCLSCHAGDPRKGGLDLSRRESALAGGDTGPAVDTDQLDASPLLERAAEGEMPPGNPLKPEQVAVLRAWITAGAPYPAEPLAALRAGPDWWSLRPIRRPEVPAVADGGWSRSPIDAFVRARLEAAGLEPAPEADRATYIRRLTFDLTGLPPAPEAIDAFLGDKRPDAFERLVDGLLASPAYGERQARHWLDVVRFAESHGYETNQLRPNAWPYRDYVVRAFNRDTPFADFVAEQLAGDTMADADWLTKSATGFLVGGAHDVVGNLAPEGMLQQRFDDLDDMITATGTAFLGLSVQCARCHDHKFDPIRQEDYYGLLALLTGVRHTDRDLPAPDAERRARDAEAIVAELARLDRELDGTEPLARPDAPAGSRPAVNSRRNVERFAPVPARYVRFAVNATNNGSEPCLDELEIWTAGPDPRNAAIGATPAASSTYPDSPIHRLEHLNDGRLGNGRSWISAEAGRGWVTLELPQAESIDRVVWGRDREEKYRDRTPTDYTIEVAEEPDRWVVVASSADRRASTEAAEAGAAPGRGELLARQKALRDRLDLLKPTIAVYAGTFAPAEATHLLLRGDPMRKGTVAPPAVIRSVRPGLEIAADTPEAARRLALARWIADPANPLPARVMVNRVWQGHFGQGIVGTPSDYGFNGERPSHPELLDWLAAEFLANGGQLKPIHRAIVLSSTYRQSGRLDERAFAADRAGRLLWRFPPRRLEAEEIRDATLAVAGSLDRRMEGPGYWIWEPNTNYVVVFRPLVDLGPEHFRRMVYQYKARSQADPTFGAFDCPDGGLVAPRRNSSTTALQALNLLNSRFVLAQSERFAGRLRAEAQDDEALVDRAFRLAFGRPPGDREREGALAVVREHGAATLARALFNANEFLFVR